MQDQLNSLIHAFEDIMSSSSNYICYTKLIETDIKTAAYLPSTASKPYTLIQKHQEWVTKEPEDLEKAEIIQNVFPIMFHLL